MPNEWLTPILGLIGIVAALVAGAAFISILRGKKWLPTKSAHQLEVLERLMLDQKRQLVKVRWADKEHLILLGVQTELLVESRTLGEQTEPQLNTAPTINLSRREISL